MPTEEMKMLYRDALELYRATSKTQSLLVKMFMNEFLDLGEEEERRKYLNLNAHEDVPI